jgi:hypothetical protein
VLKMRQTWRVLGKEVNFAGGKYNQRSWGLDPVARLIER